ncbi:MAG: hypothetical protein GVY18_08285, partial [Bacteroidetes bacterium]|nr:hypothetical protein [Bacteroidota bacterium]
MARYDASFQLTSPTSHFDATERVGLAMVGLGALALMAAFFGAGAGVPLAMLLLSFGLLGGGALIYFRRHLRKPAGIDNDGMWLSGATA